MLISLTIDAFARVVAGTTVFIAFAVVLGTGGFVA